MTLHIRRLAAPLILALPLLIGVSTALAFTSLTIGQLNLVTGFLVTALFGLGVDFEIHLYLRYLEELGKQHDRKAAMRTAMVQTLPACMTAATTTAAAFFAMTISDFRGFREYGVIAGMSVLITLVSTYVVLPPLAVLLSRKGKRQRLTPARGGLRYGVAVPMVLAGVALLVFSLLAASQVRWRTDFRKLRGDSETVDFSYFVGDLLGGSLTPAGILVQDVGQARRVHQYLDALVQDPNSAVKQYLSLASMVPSDAEHKLPILRKIQHSLESVLEQKLKPQDRQRVEDALMLARARPWTTEEIPLVFRRQFQTVDGDGQFVVVWPRFPTHEEDKVIAWGQALERIRVDLRERGIPVRILAENRIAARVLTQMREDAPLVLGAAALAVLLILVLDFRSPRLVLVRKSNPFRGEDEALVYFPVPVFIVMNAHRIGSFGELLEGDPG